MIPDAIKIGITCVLMAWKPEGALLIIRIVHCKLEREQNELIDIIELRRGRRAGLEATHSSDNEADV